MNGLFLLLLLCGCNNNGTNNCNSNSCGCQDNCGGGNILDNVCDNISSDCGCGNNFDGRGMEPRMDARPFMTFQGGTCGCEDNSAHQNSNNNCGCN